MRFCKMPKIDYLLAANTWKLPRRKKISITKSHSNVIEEFAPSLRFLTTTTTTSLPPQTTISEPQTDQISIENSALVFISNKNDAEDDNEEIGELAKSSLSTSSRLIQHNNNSINSSTSNAKSDVRNELSKPSLASPSVNEGEGFDNGFEQRVAAVSLKGLLSNKMPIRNISLIYFALLFTLLTVASCTQFGSVVSNGKLARQQPLLSPIDLQIPLNSNTGLKSLGVHSLSLSSMLGSQLTHLLNNQRQNSLKLGDVSSKIASESASAIGSNAMSDRWTFASLNRRQTRLQRLTKRLSERLGARNTIRVHNAFRDFLWTILSSLSMPTPVIYELRRMNLYSSEEDALNDALHDKNTTKTIRYKRLLNSVADAGLGKLSNLSKFAKLSGPKQRSANDGEENDDDESDDG